MRRCSSSTIHHSRFVTGQLLLYLHSRFSSFVPLVKAHLHLHSHDYRILELETSPRWCCFNLWFGLLRRVLLSHSHQRGQVSGICLVLHEGTREESLFPRQLTDERWILIWDYVYKYMRIRDSVSTSGVYIYTTFKSLLHKKGRDLSYVQPGYLPSVWGVWIHESLWLQLLSRPFPFHLYNPNNELFSYESWGMAGGLEVSLVNTKSFTAGSPPTTV